MNWKCITLGLFLFLTACQGDRITTSSQNDAGGEIQLPAVPSGFARPLSKPAIDDMCFTDPLTGPTSPHLGPIDGDYGYTPAGLARIQSNSGTNGTGPSSTDRPIVRTISGGFLNSDFVAELTVSRTISFGSDLIYFGFGEGVPNAGFFNEPTNAFLFRIHQGAVGNRVDAVAASQVDGWVDFKLGIGGVFSSGDTFRIEKSGDDVTLSIVGKTGASYSLSASSLAGVLDGSNGYIFFGNSATGTTFSNLDVCVTTADTTPPVITLNGDEEITLECHSDSYTEQGATAVDDVDGPVPVSISGSVDTNTPGDYTITYSATDAAGNTATATRTVHVVDTTPPSISLSVNPTTLWPPNHTMHLVVSGASASDACCLESFNVSVTSNEPENGTGDGDTAPDWEVVDNGDGTFDVSVRAERVGGGSGRVYTITATAADCSGNTASASGEVTVAHDKGKGKGKK